MRAALQCCTTARMLGTTDLLQPRCPDRRRWMTARSSTATSRSTPQTAASTPRTVELGEESLLEEVAHHANPAVARAKTTSAAVDRIVRRPRSLRAVRGSVPARRWRFGLRDCGVRRTSAGRGLAPGRQRRGLCQSAMRCGGNWAWCLPRVPSAWRPHSVPRRAVQHVSGPLPDLPAKHSSTIPVSLPENAPPRVQRRAASQALATAQPPARPPRGSRCRASGRRLSGCPAPLQRAERRSPGPGDRAGKLVAIGRRASARRGQGESGRAGHAQRGAARQARDGAARYGRS